jgi:excisionase family DNA binding protein
VFRSARMCRPFEEGTVLSPGGDAPVTPLVDAKELATRLGVSKSHVFELAAKGRLPHVRVGRSIRFDVDKVMEALGGR